MITNSDRRIIADLLNKKMQADNLDGKKVAELCYVGRSTVYRAMRGDADISDALLMLIVKTLELPYEAEKEKRAKAAQEKTEISNARSSLLKKVSAELIEIADMLLKVAEGGGADEN